VFSVQERIKSDDLLRNPKMSFKVIPEQAGIQEMEAWEGRAGQKWLHLEGRERTPHFL
jgi:hypothetical protein